AQVGVSWNHTGAGWQPTVMLPSHGDVTSSTPVDLGWAKGTQYQVAVTAPVAPGDGEVTVELHTVAQLGSKRAVDFFASAPNGEQLSASAPVLRHLLQSATRLG